MLSRHISRDAIAPLIPSTANSFVLTRSNDAENEKERLLSVSLHALSQLAVKDTEHVRIHSPSIQIGLGCTDIYINAYIYRYTYIYIYIYIYTVSIYIIIHIYVYIYIYIYINIHTYMSQSIRVRLKV